jgi:hypothetical protein
LEAGDVEDEAVIVSDVGLLSCYDSPTLPPEIWTSAARRTAEPDGLIDQQDLKERS